MRRLSAIDAILLATVALWSLNYSASKYVLDQGFQPLAFSSLRYACAVVLFAAITLARERSLRVGRRDLITLLLPAAGLLLVNQLSFMYALKLTSASTVALILGTVPVFVGLLAWGFGLEQLRPSFWLAAALSFVGVALVALGAGEVSGNPRGDLLAVLMSASWAAYSLLVLPLMQRYSPWRIGTIVMATTSIPLLAVASPQIASQSFDFDGLTWLAFVYSFVGPLVAGQVLWFVAIERVGASRGALFANLQPFGGVFFALLLLSEHLSKLEVVGGALIALGIVVERRAHRVAGSRLDAGAAAVAAKPRQPSGSGAWGRRQIDARLAALAGSRRGDSPGRARQIPFGDDASGNRRDKPARKGGTDVGARARVRRRLG